MLYILNGYLSSFYFGFSIMLSWLFFRWYYYEFFGCLLITLLNSNELNSYLHFVLSRILQILLAGCHHMPHLLIQKYLLYKHIFHIIISKLLYNCLWYNVCINNLEKYQARKEASTPIIQELNNFNAFITKQDWFFIIFIYLN